MKKLNLFIFVFFSISLDGISQNGWMNIYTFPEDVSSICFIDSVNGFAGTGLLAGSKKIMKTTDAGYNWTDVLQTDYVINNLYFYNHNIGFAVCENGKIYKTLDSGINWILLPFSDSNYVYNIFFLDENIGWACLGSDKIIKTIDGGNNWTASTTPNAIANQDVEFINDSIGYAVGLYAYIFKSTNGGTTWEQLPMIFSMFDIDFVDENLGFLICGEWILKTTDGGNSWITVNSSSGAQLNSIATFSNKFVWAVGTDKIYYSSNSGSDWVAQSYTPYSYLQKVSCIDSVNVWILGDKKLYRTTSGGVLDINEIGTRVIGNFELSQNYPNPFNPSTKISYQIPKAGNVEIKVFDVLGREVATLVDEYKNAFSYDVEFNTNSLPSGIYFYQLKAGKYLETRKMVLIK